MNQKLPYYMAYPMPLAYDDEKIERLDYEYLKSMYPMMPKQILPYVEDECDRMEYECSMMYDEYPDKLQLRMMCKRIVDQICMTEKKFWQEPGKDWLGDMIEVMLYQELYKRRCDHRRCKRKFY